MCLRQGSKLFQIHSNSLQKHIRVKTKAWQTFELTHGTALRGHGSVGWMELDQNKVGAGGIVEAAAAAAAAPVAVAATE